MNAKAMVNIPLGDTMGLRVACIWLNRDGYTKNAFLDTRIDDRDLYSVRGSLRWEPSPDTTIDLMASYFHERDKRTPLQKQLCQRDPTGLRSEERRGGTECVRTCRSRWSPDH